MGEQVQKRIDEAGNLTTRAMTEALAELADPQETRIFDDDVENLLDTMQERSQAPYMLDEAQMQASVEDAYRAAHYGEAPPAGWAPHHARPSNRT